LLLEDYPSKIIGWQGPRSRPANVWALALGKDRPLLTNADHERYQSLMRQYARMPLSWQRWLRLSLGRVLFGAGHFAPYLQQELWQTRLLNTPYASRRLAPQLASPINL
jgi:hypothetical protein